MVFIEHLLNNIMRAVAVRADRLLVYHTTVWTILAQPLFPERFQLGLFALVHFIAVAFRAKTGNLRPPEQLVRLGHQHLIVHMMLRYPVTFRTNDLVLEMDVR